MSRPVVIIKVGNKEMKEVMKNKNKLKEEIFFENDLFF